MDDVTFYNRHGQPIAYMNDGIHIYLFNGTPVAYLHDESVYSYRGVHLGRYQNGWVRDNNGHCVFFTEHAQGGGPARPAKHAKPAKGARHARPAKSARQAKPAKPVSVLAWSDLSGQEFFYR